MDTKSLHAHNEDSDQTAQMHVTAQVSACFDWFYLLLFHIRPYYRTHPYKRIVKPSDYSLCAFCLILLYKCICCGLVGWGITSYIWHSMDVRAEWPPFSALPSK